MGTSIELTLGDVSLDYAKNHMGIDYGFLFQPSDLCRRHCGGIDYGYYAARPEEAGTLADCELAFARSLSRVLPRLHLMGHTLESARSEYKALLEDSAVYFETDSDEKIGPPPLTFEEFCSLANLYPLDMLSTEYVEYDTEDRDEVAKGRFAAHSDAFSRLPWTASSDLFWSESSYLSAKMCILSSLSMLLIFGQNPANAGAEVTWQFGPIVNAGWVDRSAFSAGSRRTQGILVATEGASDARIIRRALDVLRPEVSDFVRFIDADERHHFWGTGNLVRFAEGLLRIDIQNRVLFLLDNDAEGVDAHRKLQALKMPGNMRSMVLPILDEFRRFPALGPEGLSQTDINGRAAAVECYLDLRLENYPPARVIWSNYKKDVGAWHGALEYKESYMRHFLSKDPATLAGSGYDTSKLEAVLDALIAEASLISEAV